MRFILYDFIRKSNSKKVWKEYSLGGQNLKTQYSLHFLIGFARSLAENTLILVIRVIPSDRLNSSRSLRNMNGLERKYVIQISLFLYYVVNNWIKYAVIQDYVGIKIRKFFSFFSSQKHIKLTYQKLNIVQMVGSLVIS